MSELLAYRWVCWLHVLLLLILLGIGDSQSIVETLPGFPGKLPFTLETGYVGVGDAEEVQLFYYFIQSQREPFKDPLVLWLTGGPGCSGLSGLLYEIGPLTFNYETYNGSVPEFQKNPYSWTQVANIIFLDAPVGTGFSYSNTSEGFNNCSDTTSSESTYAFLKKWMRNHPKFSFNPLYIAGDSYGGIIVPLVVDKIATGIKAKVEPLMNLQGYMLGNPVTELHSDENSRVSYAHRVALISDELYEAAKNSCSNEYVYPDTSNAECTDNLKLIRKCMGRVNDAHILEPKCSFVYPNESESQWGKKLFDDIPVDIVELKPQRKKLWCRNSNYMLSYMWANDLNVQEALHVRNGTITDWKRCNKSLSYDYNINSVVPYHRNLTESVYRTLIYSGDHDMLIPYVGTKEWVASLNITTVDPWRPWFVDGQIAGYTVKYEENGFRLTFATVKGAGHTAPEYKPKQCLAMVDRWFAHYML